MRGVPPLSLLPVACPGILVGADVHFYDEAGVGHCGGHNRSDEWDGGPGYLWQKRNILHQWRKDRLRQELFLHLMHSLGIVQWRQ